VISAGARTAVVRCEVRNDRGDVCAAGLGTFMTRRVHATDPDGMAPPKG
jgi:acyl-coenzyme A thioesterase PaaI-like protein